MSGKRITQLQRELYMKSRQQCLTQETSAAKADISERTGRRLEKEGFPEPIKRHWDTRKDPLIDVWDSELLPLLELESTLTGLTLWEYLEEKYPDTYPHSILRTLQRRVKHFKATQGPDKVVMFRQSMPPGQQGLSDFTHPRTAITILGKPFEHIIYQFRLACSGWRDATIIQGGESYSALSDGLQNALHKLGGSPKEHRTDSLSAAYINQSQKKKLTQSYDALCAHYGLVATRNNLGVSHENGAVETAHGSLKHRIDQAIKLRGSNDFDSIKQYQQLIDKCISRLNCYSQSRLKEEQKYLTPLPKQRFIAYSEMVTKVTTGSMIVIKHTLYSVPSRLIGETIRVHIYHDRLIGFVGQTQVFHFNRVYCKKRGCRARSIDYRHVIHSLASKPQAFRFSKYQDELFPDDNYRQLWRLVDQQLEPRDACKWMVGVLRIAANSPDEYQKQHEQLLGETLLQQSQANPLPTLKKIQSLYLQKQSQEVVLSTPQHDIVSYDQLLTQPIINQAEGEIACH